MTTITYPELINRLTDLKRLAQPPAEGEQGGCQSSYDRRSRYDPATGLYDCLYAVVAYWYQAVGQTDPYKPVPLEERIGYWEE